MILGAIGDDLTGSSDLGLNEKCALKEGRVPDEGRDRPAKLAQKDRDARWTVLTMQPATTATERFGRPGHARPRPWTSA